MVTLLASGRDADVYDAGPGRVRREYRTPGFDVEHEVAAIEHVVAAGYPAPRVLDSGPSWIVSEAVSGPTMLEAILRQPSRTPELVEVLADLHERLHAIAAPPWLREAPERGDVVVHLDLHPGNVILGPDGPCVIDWTNVARGAGDADLAQTWLILATSTEAAPGAPAVAALVGPAVAKRFRRRVGDAGIERCLPTVAAMRLGDPNLHLGERARIRRLLNKQAVSQRKERHADIS